MAFDPVKFESDLTKLESAGLGDFCVMMRESRNLVFAHKRLQAERDELLAVIKAALRIKDLWLPVAKIGPEHEAEAMALSSMHDAFAEAVAKAESEATK